ncbi:MAG: hypothetical protein ACO1OB_20325 [Archangium sp.]
MYALLALALASTPCPTGEPLEGGQHRRLELNGGVAHTWCRGNFDRVVFYVHGYRDTVDSAFEQHKLAKQFSDSRAPALFIAVDAPASDEENVSFTNLDALVNELSRTLKTSLPARTLLMGHSGAHRTLRAWLSSSRATDVVLLDGFYGDGGTWTKWLEQPNSSLRLVGQATWDAGEAWRSELPASLLKKVTHVPAGVGHMEIVTAGDWIPRVLHAGLVDES